MSRVRGAMTTAAFVLGGAVCAMIVLAPAIAVLVVVL